MENFEIPQNNNEEIQEASGEWKTKAEIARDLKVSASTVRRMADKYTDSNPEYFNDDKGRQGAESKYYSPKLIDILERSVAKFKETPEALEGWKNIGLVAKELGVDRQKIQSLLEKYRKSNPEYFRNFKTNTHVVEHFSPELISLLSEDVKKYKSITEAPEGWKTNPMIAKELGVDYKTILLATNEYRESNPEDFHEYKVRGQGQVTEHYSPSLVQILTQKINEIKNIPYAPEGWKTLSKIAKQHSFFPENIKKITDNFRKNNPEYFQIFRDKSHKPAEHYSPKLVEVIESEIDKKREIKEAPEGWENINSIARKLNTFHNAVKKIIDKHREANPQEFDKFKSKNTQIQEHFSPKMVKIVEQEVLGKSGQEAPENWLSTDKISESTGISKEDIERIAKKLRQKHPGKFGKFKNKDNQ